LARLGWSGGTEIGDFKSAILLIPNGDFESEWKLSAVPFKLLASIESLGLRELERRLSNFRPKGATAFLGCGVCQDVLQV